MPTNEQQPSTPPAETAAPAAAEQQRMRTLAVRVDEGLHAQLQFIAHLSGTTLADEVRGAIEHRITSAQDDQDLLARAEAARDEIEREAAARSAAIAGFIGHTATANEQPATTTARPRRSSKSAASQEPRP